MDATRRVAPTLRRAIGLALLLTLAITGCSSESAGGPRGTAIHTDVLVCTDTAGCDAAVTDALQDVDAGRQCPPDWCGENERCVVNGWTPECLCAAPFRWYETVTLPENPSKGLRENSIPLEVCRKPMPPDRLRCITGDWTPEGGLSGMEPDPGGLPQEPYIVIDDRERGLFRVGSMSVELRDDGEGTRFREDHSGTPRIEHIQVVNWDPDNIMDGHIRMWSFHGRTGECLYHDEIYPFLPHYWVCAD